MSTIKRTKRFNQRRRNKMKNADKYTTMEERSEAFAYHCRVRPCCEDCPVYKMVTKQKNRIPCEFAWLELEATEDTWKSKKQLKKQKNRK
jgi:hypothetical protein